ncbi:AraC family transcriptional regulator [Phycisphaera mikurensis]|uniref:AraC family transcriptional regulator n=1 Tax=Phycisphaera mikurensis TaxID=547188 RepID=UPI0012B5C2FD|nr:AraC family transcriptional regulator [Phycisphaera mikurensis]MBB6441926.1 AraC-like DNA-binding protein [Phycisphaera mikurensis]
MVKKQQTEAAPRRAVRVEEPPGVAIACYTPMPADAFGTGYLAPTHALHLYEYDATLRLCGRELALRRGTLSFTPAGEESRYRVPRAGRHWCVHFAAEEGAGDDRGRLDLPLVWDAGDLAADARSRFERLVALAADRPARGAGALLERSLRVAALELVLWFARESSVAGPPDRRRVAEGVGVHPAVARLVAIVQRDLHRPLRAASLAAEVGMSQNHLARLFREVHGCTIPAWILRRRIELATLLLATTDLPVKAIGHRVGLPDPQHFNKQCRRLTGTSPSAIRRRGGAAAASDRG